MGGCLHPAGSIACGCGNVTTDAAPVGGGLTDTERAAIQDSSGAPGRLNRRHFETVEAIVARRVAAAVQATTARVLTANCRCGHPVSVHGLSGCERPIYASDGAFCVCDLAPLSILRAALAGSTDPTPDTRTKAEERRNERMATGVCGVEYDRHPTQPHLVAVCTLPIGHAGEHHNVLPKPGQRRADALDPTHDGTPKETP